VVVHLRIRSMQPHAVKIHWQKKSSYTSGLASILFFWLSIFQLVPQSLGRQNPEPAGQVQGTVFVQDSKGQSNIAKAKVTLKTAAVMETETDESGKFEFRSVPPGSYILEAAVPGLLASQAVTVEMGKVAEISLELKPSAVQDSVTVTANANENASTPASPPGTVTASSLRNAPNIDDRAESILPTLPGVVRGPDGRINLKGARSTQSGALVNSANATDPATGNPGIAVPIDVVSSVQVISNPYDPQYGKLTGAVSTLETKTSNFEGFHASIQNFMPRARVRDGTISGIGSATPRVTFTGPIWTDHIAFTQSLEYRFVRTPVNSLPPYQRGYQLYGQHRYLTGNESLLTSQFTYKTFDVDITPAGSGPYQLLVETTEGGFFNSQKRRASRFDWEEMYQFAPRHFLGTHQWHVGLEYAYSNYGGVQSFSPVEIQGAKGRPIERITFTGGGHAYVTQHEVTWFAADQWTVSPRLLLDLGVRFDSDTVTSSVHAAPRVGFQLALTRSGRTMLRGGIGEFYDRVPLMIPAFQWFPERTVFLLDPVGQVTRSTAYTNKILGSLRNPRSTAWNLALSQKVSSSLLLQAAYEQRNTAKDFVVSTVDGSAGTGLVTLSNNGGQSYKELQLTGRYQFRKHFINASYVHSRAYGDLNDFFQFYGNVAKPVIQPNGQGRLPFDAPNRFLLSGEIHGPWKLVFVPVYDLHTGFPYSVQNEFREYVGPRNTRRYPQFSSFDLQVSRPLSIPMGGDRRLKTRVGLAAFNLFNQFNPRDVQNIEQSARFGGFFNNAWREYRGKFVVEF
jgi:hypothetical protein